MDTLLNFVWVSVIVYFMLNTLSAKNYYTQYSFVNCGIIPFTSIPPIKNRRFRQKYILYSYYIMHNLKVNISNEPESQIDIPVRLILLISRFTTVFPFSTQNTINRYIKKFAVWSLKILAFCIFVNQAAFLCDLARTGIFHCMGYSNTVYSNLSKKIIH